jgi:hypothetical protein
VQNEACILDIDLGVPVHRERQSQVGQELRFEVIVSFDAAPKLRQQGLPGDWPRRRKRMQPIGQPSIDIECHRVVVDRLDRQYLAILAVRQGPHSLTGKVPTRVAALAESNPSRASQGVHALSPIKSSPQLRGSVPRHGALMSGLALLRAAATSRSAFNQSRIAR